ncbi:MAG: response regulator [Thermodesulfobacteriota bacterium]
MARILVGVGSPEAARIVRETLEEEGHEVLAANLAGAASGGPSRLAEAFLARDPDLVVADYLVEDALSVKAMQESLGRSPFLKFIFVLDRDPGLVHLVLALNEGATALLVPPLSRSALANYVARGLNRRREEITRSTELDRCRHVIEKEKACTLEQADELSQTHRRLRQSYRLINHLLATVGTGRKEFKVLLVSDSTFQVDLFRRPLEDHNFQVLSAPDGQKGLETAQREKPRIIVSDLEMPGLNGLELCRAVKNDQTLAPNHFIVCTANQNKIPDVLKPENMVDDCLLKPGRPEDFQEFLARVALGLLT